MVFPKAMQPILKMMGIDASSMSNMVDVLERELNDFKDRFARMEASVATMERILVDSAYTDNVFQPSLFTQLPAPKADL